MEVNRNINYSYKDIKFDSASGHLYLPDGREYEILIGNKGSPSPILSQKTQAKAAQLVKEFIEKNSSTFSELDLYTINTDSVKSKQLSTRIQTLFSQAAKELNPQVPVPKVGQIQLKKVEEGLITDSYYDDKKNLVGREEMRRINTVDAFIGSKMEHSRHLQKQLTLTTDPAKKELIEKKLEIIKKTLEQALEFKKQGGTWVGNKSFINYKKKSADFDPSRYPPLVNNLRREKVVDQKGQTIGSFNRSGALSDWRNGATDIQQIEETLKALEGIEYEWDLSIYLNDPNTIEILNRILEGEKALSSEGKVSKTISNLKTTLDLAEKEQLVSKLKQLQLERSFALENMLLQDLMTHLEDQEIDENTPLNFVRLGLLNSKGSEKVVDKSFVRNEHSQIRDMEYIYDQFNGKTVIFDGKGPFVDEEGNIHLPIRTKSGKPISKTLNAAYSNISISAGRDEKGIQRDLNDKAFARIREMLIAKYGPKKAEQKIEILNKIQYDLRVFPKNKKINLAERLGAFLMDEGISLSVNCFSGKDRTGVVSALLVRHALGKELTHHKKKDQLLDRFGEQMLSSRGTAIRSLADNTGMTGLKIIPHKIDLSHLVSTRDDFLKGFRSLKADAKMYKKLLFNTWQKDGRQGKGIIGQ